MNAPTPIATPITPAHHPVTLSRADRALMQGVSIQVEPESNGWVAWVLDCSEDADGKVIVHSHVALTPGEAFELGMQAYLRELSERQESVDAEAKYFRQVARELRDHERAYSRGR